MKDFKSLVKFAWRFLESHKMIIYLYILIGLLYSSVELINTFVLGESIDIMLIKGTKQAIFECAIVFLGLNLLILVLAYFAKTQGQKAMEIAVKECKIQLAQHIEAISLNDTEKMGAASCMQRLNYDAQMLIMYVINTMAQIPQHIITYVCGLIVIMSIDVVCGVVALLEIPVIILGYLLFRKRLAECNQETADKRGVEYRRLYELVTDVGHLKKNHIFSMMKKRYEEAEDDFIRSTIKCVRVEYFYSILNNNLDVFLKIFFFFYGGISVINATMTVGEFMIIYSFFGLITSSCTYFLDFGSGIQGNMAFYNRLKEITDVPEESNGCTGLDKINKIEFSNMAFAYKGNEPIIKNFSYTFEKGKLYVVAGENGCGKSTMTSLLSGMYIDEFEGNISYNDISVKNLDMRRLRKENLGICEQEPFLINDTIRFNMIYSNDKNNDERLMQIAKKVSFDGFLKNSENGLDTLVGQRGNNLSGGQKQKTALVKVFYKNTDVMILDEPTSAMDAEGQERLINYLSEIKKDKIIIVVTHDEKMMEVADEVVRM